MTRAHRCPRRGVVVIDVHAVEAEAERQGLISRVIEGQRLATTHEVLDDESGVLKFARDG